MRQVTDECFSRKNVDRTVILMATANGPMGRVSSCTLPSKAAEIDALSGSTEFNNNLKSAPPRRQRNEPSAAKTRIQGKTTMLSIAPGEPRHLQRTHVLCLTHLYPINENWMRSSEFHEVSEANPVGVTRVTWHETT